MANALDQMYTQLKDHYDAVDNIDEGLYNESLENRRKRRLALQQMGGLGHPLQYLQTPPDQGMASDIFSAIGNPMGGMIPGILSAIFKKRS